MTACRFAKSHPVYHSFPSHALYIVQPLTSLLHQIVRTSRLALAASRDDDHVSLLRHLHLRSGTCLTFACDTSRVVLFLFCVSYLPARCVLRSSSSTILHRPARSLALYFLLHPLAALMVTSSSVACTKLEFNSPVGFVETIAGPGTV